MTAEIICVGTELLLGDIVNTNAQFLSRELAELGISVLHEHVIGDNPERLRELVCQARSRSDLLVFSGGLGPTEDDLTKETVAEAFGDTLHFDETEWQKIVDFFARTHRTPTPNNRKQAMVPTQGHKIPNAHGTAPGAWFEDAQGHCAVLMPGVPREMKAMWVEQIRPALQQRQNCTIHSRTLRVLGGESSIASKVAPLFDSTNPTAAIYCKTGESEIRVTAREATAEAAEAACNAYLDKFRAILGDAAYDVDVPALEYTVVRVLRERGLHAATAESCTGGMIAERLTNVPGSSEVFGFGFVTYAEAAKQKLLGVDPALIETYNVVSGPVAVAMAFGAAKVSGAELAVGITGIAGPGGALPGKPVGTVYLAGADTRTGQGWLLRLTLGGYHDRGIIRTRAALYALDLLRRMALGLPVPDGVPVREDTPPEQTNF
ncbi:competence/damage-inducible protein A [uncultured Subdoligranulum sp.]|uniref:competence/damage-inducible protein A n=1 Tax=uncultured Subdoligranulum sp. TaxID=512298 RepID=UPI0026130456|nr:competence/damage-inducible protein A [uncultured Subdoligranulum sp.]